MPLNYHIHRARNISDEYRERCKINQKEAHKWLQQKLKIESNKIKHMVCEINESRGLV